MTKVAVLHAPSAREAKRGLRTLARVGFVASAVIHLLLGVLAVRVALHHSAESDQTGAIAQIGRLPGGPFLLWTMTVGLFALAAWLLLEAVLGIGSGPTRRWARAAVTAAKAAAYLALAVPALAFARGGSSNAKTSTEHASSSVLALPGGQLLLGLIGLVALGVGIHMVVKGARRGFWKDLEPVDGVPRRVVAVLGVVGYVAKGVAVAAVGVLFGVAAVTTDPARATGLDGALRALADLPLGTALLLGVAAGLVAFGAYTVARARYARL